MIELERLPKGWVIAKLRELVITEKGKKPKRVSKEKTEECSIPYVNIKAFEKNIIDEYTDGVGCVICEDDDFLMVWDGSRSGYVGKAIKGALGSTLVRIKLPLLNQDYVYYFLQSKFIEINTRAKGVGIPHVDPNLLWNYDFPIAPFAEQTRILAKLEQLLTGLDKGIEYLKTAQQQLKVYRQAVLKWAFEGKLTNEDGKDGELPKGWKWKTIDDVADISTGVTPLRTNKSYWEKGTIPWITSGTLNNEFVTKADEFVTKKAFEETTLKLLPKHTLLLALYGEGKTRGKCSELMFESTTNQAIAGIKLKEEFEQSRRFLKWFLLKNYQDIRLLSAGGVQPNLNSTIVKKTQFPFPPTQEQNKIIKEIESRLSVCDKIEETIADSLQQAEALRLSIIKKAFEGKLVPQDPNDEPAEKLLERIKLEKLKKEQLKKRKNKSGGKIKRIS